MVPGWTAYDHHVSEVSLPVTTVGYMPIIPAPATEYDTVWAVILQCQGIARFLHQSNTVLTFDEGIYCKAKELAWLHNEKCQDLVLRLGGFHICMNFLKIIGQHYEFSGLSDVLIECGIYSESVVKNILGGKQLNRAIRCHKLMFDTLWRIYLQKLWLGENHEACIFLEDLNGTTTNIAEAAKKKETTDHLPEVKKCIADLKAFLKSFDQDQNPVQHLHTGDSTMSVHGYGAEREGLWQLHVSSFARMLPWMALYDHINYRRWGTVYLSDVSVGRYSSWCTRRV